MTKSQQAANTMGDSEITPDADMRDGGGQGFLKAALAIIAVGVILYGILLALIAPEQYFRAIGPLLMPPVALLALVLLHRSKVQGAFRVLTFGTWAVITFAAAFAGGVRAPVLFAYPILVVMSGWLLGLRTAVITAVLTLASAGFFLLAEQAGILPSAPPAPAVLIWLVQTITIVTSTVLIGFVLHRYAERYRIAKALGDELSVRLSDLAAQERQLRMLAENIPAFIFQAGRDLRCRYANRRYAEFFGFTPETIIGKSVADILGDEAASALGPRIGAVLGGETVRYRAVRRSAADGEEHHLDISFVPERDASGAVVGFYALKLDVTAEVQAEQALRQQNAFREAFMQAQSDAGLVMFIIEAGRIVYSNDAACRTFGYTHEEMRALPGYLELAHPDDRERITQNHQRRLRGEKFENNYRISFVTKSGERRAADLTAAFMPGPTPRVLVILADATERLRAERALQESEARFRRLFEQVPTVAVQGYTPDGTVIFWNKANESVYGYTRDEVMGRSLFELIIPPAMRDEVRSAIRRMADTGVGEPAAELRLMHKNGSLVPVFSSHVVLENAAGQKELYCLDVDLTERKKTEATLAEREALLREAQRIGHVGSWALDLATLRMSWSDELYRIYELGPGDFGGTWKHLMALVHPDDAPRLREAWREAAHAEGNYELRHRILTPGGRTKDLHIRFEVFRDDQGRPVRAVGTAQDVTDQVRARAEIQQLNEKLEARVRERTAELQSANKELESFAYSISHDLRAPLRGIDGFSHLLDEEYGDKLDEQGRGYLKRVRGAAQRMGALIDDILELSRVTRKQMVRKRVDLSRMATEILDELRQGDPERSVEVRVAEGIGVQGDPQLLRVMMQNLLENAWKYSGRTDRAHIEFGREAEGEGPCLFVRDNGAGFEMRYAGRLFAPFQRLHKPSEFEGTGIGLATVARIVQRHGGWIRAEAEPGRGATFRFALAGSGAPAQDEAT